MNIVLTIRNYSKILIYLLTYLIAQQALASKKIFSWQHDLKNLPLSELVFTDPSIETDHISNEKVFGVYNHWKLKKSMTGKDILTSPLEDLWENMTEHITLYNYLITRYYRKTENLLKIENSYEESKLLKNRVLQIIEALLTHDLNQEQQSILAYQKLLFNAQNSIFEVSAIETFKENNLNFMTQKQKDLFLYIEQIPKLYSSNSSVRDQAISILAGLRKKLSSESIALVHMLLSRLKVGYDLNGNKISWFHPSYQRHLNIISSTCNKISHEGNEKILNFLLSTWTSAKDFKNSWNKIPFSVECYSSNTPYFAIIENQADLLLKNGETHKALQKLEKIFTFVKNKSQLILLQNKIITLSENMFQKTQDFEFFQNKFVYVLGKNNPQNKSLEEKFFNLTKNYITKSKKTLSDTHLDQITTTFVNSVSNEKYINEILNLQAEFYANKNNYEKSWQIYFYLSNLPTTNTEKFKHLQKAISSYTKLIKWDHKNPWKQSENHSPQTIQELFKLYSRLNDLTDIPELKSWDTILNLGVLYILNQDEMKSYKLFLDYWKSNSIKPDTKIAAGYLIHNLLIKEAFDEAKEVYSFVVSQGITPHWDNENFALNKNLTDDKTTITPPVDLDHKNTNISIEKLKILVDAFPNDPYKFENIKKIIEHFSEVDDKRNEIKYLDMYLRSKEVNEDYKKYLLRALYLAKGMGDISRTTKFYKYLQKYFPTTQEIAELQKILQPLCNIVGKNLECMESLSLEQKEPSNRLPASDLIEFDKVLSKDSHENILNTQPNARIYIDKDILNDTKSVMKLYPIQKNIKELENKLEKGITDHNVVLSTYNGIRQNIVDTCQSIQVNFCIEGVHDLLVLSEQVYIFLKKHNNQRLTSIFKNHQLKIKQRLESLTSQYLTLPEVTEKTLWSLKKDWNFKNNQYTEIGFFQLSTPRNIH